MALRQTDKASLRIFERNPLHPELPTEFALAWPQAMRRAEPRRVCEDRPHRSAVTGSTEAAETNFRNFRKR
jgi:hypothetical protein